MSVPMSAALYPNAGARLLAAAVVVMLHGLAGRRRDGLVNVKVSGTKELVVILQRQRNAFGVRR